MPLLGPPLSAVSPTAPGGTCREIYIKQIYVFVGRAAAAPLLKEREQNKGPRGETGEGDVGGDGVRSDDFAMYRVFKFTLFSSR